MRRCGPPATCHLRGVVGVMAGRLPLMVCVACLFLLRTLFGLHTQVRCHRGRFLHSRSCKVDVRANFPCAMFRWQHLRGPGTRPTTPSKLEAQQRCPAPHARRSGLVASALEPHSPYVIRKYRGPEDSAKISAIWLEARPLPQHARFGSGAHHTRRASCRVPPPCSPAGAAAAGLHKSGALAALAERAGAAGDGGAAASQGLRAEAPGEAAQEARRQLLPG